MAHDMFSFERFNEEALKQKQEVELLKNVDTHNPKAVEKPRDPRKVDFIEVDESLLEQQQQQPNPFQEQVPQYVQQSQFQDNAMSLPYDTNSMSSSYLSLVLSPNLRELELMIRGLEHVKIKNPQNGSEEVVLRKIPGHPLNEYGINQIITQLKIYTSPEIKLGRKRTKDYYNSVQHVSRNINRLIYKNLKSFGMDTQEKQRFAKVIVAAIVEFIDAGYSRSIEGKENDLSRATEFKIEGSVDNLNNPARIINPQAAEQFKN